MNREELIDKMVAAIEKMKEETNKGVIKDYEKKYKEALEVAKRKLCFDKAGMVDSFTPNDIYEIFPELKESEDERTFIINYLSNRILNSTIIAEKENLKKAVAWLERQSEQKPADIPNASGHWWCFRFADFTTPENIELCRQYPMAGTE